MRMRTVLLAAAVAVSTAFAAIPASAADDEGRITRIDRERLTITLDNGNTYKLSTEFDVDALAEGMEVVLAYDTVAGEKLVTDMVTYE